MWDYNNLFDAVDSQGLRCSVVTYDFAAMCRQGLIYDSIYLNNRYWTSETVPVLELGYLYNGGSVDWRTSGTFFTQAGQTPKYMARDSFKGALDQFLENRYSQWFNRESVIGWDIFSEVNFCEMSGFRWGTSGGIVYDDPAYGPLQLYDNPYYLQHREEKLAEWTTEMLGHIEWGEHRNDRLGSRARRLHWVDVGGLPRFSEWDWHWPKDRPRYLGVQENDFIDYHLYTWQSDGSTSPPHLATEKPNDPFRPLRYFLGVEAGMTSLPKVIDYYRTASPRRGFFSSEFGLPGWVGNWHPPNEWSLSMQVPKRLVNDCYHNYMWMAFATGSVGGPAPSQCPGGLLPDWSMNYYDLSGDDTVHDIECSSAGLLNWYTAEVLDSMLSLSRFTSLVRLKEIENTQLHPNATAFRPMRMTKDESGGPAVQLISTTSGLALGPSEGWLWTGASDKYITVGWIVRDFGSDYQKPEKDDPLQVKPAPRVVISNLATGLLELVWFDDHKGKIIGTRPTTTNGSFDVIAPNTEATGFGKSIAFLIQPYGCTPNTSFDALPTTGDMIGQIVVSELTSDVLYHDEHPKVTYGTVRFTAWTKPQIGNPGNYNFDWQWLHTRTDEFAPDPRHEWGIGMVSSDQAFSSEDLGVWKVTLTINDLQGRRISGDIIYLDVEPEL